MFFDNNEKTNPRFREEEAALQAWPPLVRYAMEKAEITAIPVGTVGVFAADATELLGAMLPKGAINSIVVVYRYSESTWRFFNSELQLVGALRDEETCLMLYGRDMVLSKGKFSTSKFLKQNKIDETEKMLKKKFAKVPILYRKAA